MSEQRLEEALRVLKYYADRQGHDGNWNLALAAGEELTERISAAREEGRGEGFEKAREMAEGIAERCRKERETLATNEFANERGATAQAALVGKMSEADRIKQAIRAMRDGAVSDSSGKVES